MRTETTACILAAIGLLAAAAIAAEADGAWKLDVSHGAQATLTVEDGAVAVTVERPTFTGWQIAAGQKVALKGGKRYRITFEASADVDGTAHLCLQSLGESRRIEMLTNVEAGPEARTYAFVTGPIGEDGDHTVGFWLGCGPRGTYRFGGLSVEELTAEEMAELESRPEGWRNGDFAAGEEGWELRVHDAAVAAFTVDPSGKLGAGNCAEVAVTNATETGWHVQFMQIFKVEEGKEYTATFTAAADVAGPMAVAFQVPPPDNESIGSRTVELTTEPKTYSVTFPRMKRSTDMKLSFHMSGGGPRTFWIDDVSVAAPAEDDPAQ